MRLLLTWIAIQAVGALVFVLLAKFFHILIADRHRQLPYVEVTESEQLTQRIAAALRS